MQDLITRDAARSLAIRYNAFCEAIRENDRTRAAVYARLLDRSQKMTGVELVRDVGTFSAPYPDDTLTDLGEIVAEGIDDSISS